MRRPLLGRQVLSPTAHQVARGIVPDEEVSIVVCRNQALAHVVQDQLEHGGLRLQRFSRARKIVRLHQNFLLGPLALGDIAGNFRSANNCAVVVLDR